MKTFIPNVGDIVLVYGDGVGRCQWRMGRVTNLLYSNDGHIRAAEVKTITKGTNRVSIIKRSITKLYPVELSNEDNSDNVELKFIDENRLAVFGGSVS